MTVSVLRFK